MAIVYNQVSVDDTAIGAYALNWSQTAWTVQTLVSAAQVTATGGTYA